MKERASVQTPGRQSARANRPNAADGEHGIALTPPPYGIAFVDHGMAARAPAAPDVRSAPTPPAVAVVQRQPVPAQETQEEKALEPKPGMVTRSPAAAPPGAPGDAPTGNPALEAFDKLPQTPGGDRVIDILTNRLGMKPIRDKDVSGLTLQYQQMGKIWESDPKRPGALVNVKLTGQVAAKAEFNSASEVGKLTLRADKQGLRQQEIEFPWNLRAPQQMGDDDWIDLTDIRPKISLDSVAPVADEKKGLPGVPKTAGQAGIEFTFKSPKLAFLNNGSPYVIKVKTSVRIDFTELFNRPAGMNADQFLSKFLSLQVEALPIVASLDAVPPFSQLKSLVGGKWSCQFKLFMNIAGTYKFWMEAFKLGQKGAAAAARGAAGLGRLAVQGGVAAAEAAAPFALPLAIGAAGVATAVAGLLAIRRELEAGRDQAIVNAYCSGYATELDAAISNDSAWLAGEIESLSMYDFKTGLEEIMAIVHGGTAPVPYRISPSGSHSVDYANALNYAAVDLGRATVIVGIYSILQTGGEQAWLAIRDGQRRHAAERRARGVSESLRRAYLAALQSNTGGDVMTVGLPLRKLNAMF